MNDVRRTQNGDRIVLEIDLRVDGDLVSSTKEEGLLEIVLGSGVVVPGLEKALLGLAEGESFSTVVDPEDGYGDFDEEAFEHVDPSEFADQEVEVGQDYFFQDENDEPIIVRVEEIGEQGVLVNYNHPLAGETLHFNGKLVKIK